jgi:hypothetical protein
MGVRSAILFLFAPLGCNALTGVDELETVDCVECTGDSGRDSSSPRDTGSPIDTGTRDTSAIDTSIDTEPPPDTGCTSDLSCDDGNACTTDVCTLSTGECTHTVVDNDMDGESPSALGACGTDCDDNNPSVFSKQTAFFTAPYTTSGTPSFDYNCDGVAEKQYPALTVCNETGGTCMETTSGWATTIPACGQLAKRAICIKVFSCARGTATDATAQPCR